jgi:hypothetical protein
MSKHIIITLTLTAFATLPLLSQQQWCGTTGAFAEQVEQQLIENKERLRKGLVTTRDIEYIPVKFHLIGRVDGEGRIAINKLLDQLCALNEDFEPVGFQFYFHEGFNYIYNDQAFENHISVQNTVLESNRDPNALNVYIPESANFSSGSAGTVLGYFDPGFDWLVISRDEISGSSSTGPHEFGHFFGLLHPFHGWEPNAWNQADHGNPVTQNFAPDGANRVELVDGSNCNIAGDRICDTPANYNFGLGWPDCDFTEEIYDRNNDLLDPEEKLFMSYFLLCNRDDYFFTEEQIAAMQSDYLSPTSSYYRSDYVPNQTEITSTAVPQSPANGQAFERYNDIEFSWSDVEGATAYNLQIALEPTFSSPIYDEVVNGNSIVIQELEPTRLHFWRVRPFNEYRTCTNFSSFQTLSTGAITSNVNRDAEEELSVSPNPIRSGGQLWIELKTQDTFEAQFHLYDITGRHLRELGRQNIRPGNNNISLRLNRNLQAGLYLLEMRQRNRRRYSRLVISE